MNQNTIYIVEDDELYRKSLSLLLSAKGFIVKSFDNGKSFLYASHGLSPGCVLLDTQMPDMDGLEVLDTLEHVGSKLPVVIMTGYGDVDIAVHAIKLGALDFFRGANRTGWAI